MKINHRGLHRFPFGVKGLYRPLRHHHHQPTVQRGSLWLWTWLWIMLWLLLAVVNWKIICFWNLRLYESIKMVGLRNWAKFNWWAAWLRNGLAFKYGKRHKSTEDLAFNEIIFHSLPFLNPLLFCLSLGIHGPKPAIFYFLFYFFHIFLTLLLFSHLS